MLTIIRGLPGSGKSTKAKEICEKNPKAIRLNKDLLREMLCFVKKNRNDKSSLKWSGKVEDNATKAEFGLAKMFLDNHQDVIVDDTNLNEKTFKKWEDFALQNSYTYKIIDLDVPVEECIRRDALREDSVGKDVIEWFAMQHGKMEEKYDIPKEGKIIICDIDGSLSCINHRLHFLQKEGKKDWDGFFDAMDKDEPREGVISLLTDCYKGKVIVIVTGRPSNYRDKTEAWLKKHNIPYNALIMRRAGDKRPDYIVKQEILDKFIDKSRVEMVIDDRPTVIRQWRSNGLPVIDVAEGDNDF